MEVGLARIFRTELILCDISGGPLGIKVVLTNMFSIPRNLYAIAYRIAFRIPIQANHVI